MEMWSGDPSTPSSVWLLTWFLHIHQLWVPSSSCDVLSWSCLTVYLPLSLFLSSAYSDGLATCSCLGSETIWFLLAEGGQSWKRNPCCFLCRVWSFHLSWFVSLNLSGESCWSWYVFISVSFKTWHQYKEVDKGLLLGQSCGWCQKWTHIRKWVSHGSSVSVIITSLAFQDIPSNFVLIQK